MFKFVKEPKSAKLIKKISKLDDEIKNSLKDLDSIEILFISMALKQFHESICGAIEERIDSDLKDIKRADLDKKIEDLLNEK
jgi:hypothetical protein